MTLEPTIIFVATRRVCSHGQTANGEDSFEIHDKRDDNSKSKA